MSKKKVASREKMIFVSQRYTPVKKFDTIFNTIKEAGEFLKLKVTRYKDMPEYSQRHNIKEAIKKSDLIVCDFSGDTGNVSNEEGSAQAYGKKILCITHTEFEKISSNISNYHKVETYKNTKKGREILQKLLIQKFREIFQISNPTHKISVVNVKGGSGKTTTSLHLALELGKRGKKVLLIDLDPAGGATSFLTQKLKKQKNSINELVTKKRFSSKTLDKYFFQTEFENVTLIKSMQEAFESSFQVKPEKFSKTFLKIQEEFEKATKPFFDYVIFDTPGSTSPLLTEAIKNSDFILLPSEISSFALSPLRQTLHFIKKDFSTSKILGVLITKHYKKMEKTPIYKDFLEICNQFKVSPFTTKIEFNSKILESFLSLKNILSFLTGQTKTKKQIEKFVDEVVEQMDDSYH